MLEIVRREELRLGMIVDPHDDSLAVSAVCRTHTESDPDTMLSIGPDGAVFDPVGVRLFVPARPPIHMIDANRRDVEKLHRIPRVLHDERRGFYPRPIPIINRLFPWASFSCWRSTSFLGFRYPYSSAISHCRGSIRLSAQLARHGGNALLMFFITGSVCK